MGRSRLSRPVRASEPGADPRSEPRSVPLEMRGRRVMTRLLGMVAELREHGTEPTTVALSADDELHLFGSADATFGAPGHEAASQGKERWRAFLVRWFQQTIKLALTFDATETSVR